MQIQLPPIDKDFDPIADFITRIKVAYRFIKAKKAIIIIDNEVDVFNMELHEVVGSTAQIIGDLSEQIFEDMDNTKKIHNLVYGSN